jgi:hypothetical protein
LDTISHFPSVSAKHTASTQSFSEGKGLNELGSVITVQLNQK